MAEYKGGHHDSQRHAQLEKARTQLLSDFERQRQQISKDSNVRMGTDRFVSHQASVETQLKQSTVGLVKLEDFQRIRGELEEEKARIAAQTQKAGNGKPKKKKQKEKKLLSFDFDDPDENDDNDDERPKLTKRSNKSVAKADGIAPGDERNTEDPDPTPAPKRFKYSKNPYVDTSFLPDRERDEKERQIRESLRKEWLKEQERIKNETVTITYSYWDGSGHRRMVQCKKGDTIATFLEKCRQQFHELRSVSVDNLIYIKEDLIIPQHYTFYDFIVNKFRGKSGPLFNFDVREDIRIQHDASVEKDESHAGKVCQRTWYDRHKHIFPASRWETFDPKKDYGSYTIKDTRKSN
ncbi:hypothetical protein H4R33_002648 [Dimargaris cristalligena]|uniref:XAP5, circadian clock regulator-domain-containing protein n=1 Tax=Dimargaris cristalligena TaxID=215637 RepID=A0A4P9ZXF1_9FUNG|nr:hypothetical protein H4R33_002648 [Dimargaris cristalligena]RKP38375.1 XAP5, circadian clock regulator-domain-containing protein [Dimargaris cristalligena]|eukprot:RKP38375.1 XAP5, circadian clock regulator-domain-containing protein [Dimargaris cristalligena]